MTPNVVIPGRDEVASYDAQLRIGESILTIVVMDSGLDASHRPGMTANLTCSLGITKSGQHEIDHLIDRGARLGGALGDHLRMEEAHHRRGGAHRRELQVGLAKL